VQNTWTRINTLGLFFLVLLVFWQSPVESNADFAGSPAGPRLIPGWPVIAGHKILSSPAVADLNGDGRDELAVTLRDGRVLLMDGRGRLLPGWPKTTAYWNVYSPLICDVTGDGKFEVLVASWDEHVYAWRADGSPLDGWPVNCGAKPLSSPQLLKLPGEAGRYILIACDDGRVHLFDSHGSDHPAWPRRVEKPSVGYNDKFPIRNADTDGDGIPEIFLLSEENAVLHVLHFSQGEQPGFPVRLGGRGCGIALDDYANPKRIACTTKQELVVLDIEGKELFRRKLPAGDQYTSAPSFIRSLPDSKSTPDMVFAGTDKGTVCAWEDDGALRNGWPVHLGGFIYGLAGEEERFSIFDAPRAWDVDGDGQMEILVGSADQHLYCFELDGSMVPGWPLTLEDQVRAAPAFAQLDGSGPKEMVIGQYGESIFAFQLDANEPVAAWDGIQTPDLYRPGEWPRYYFAVVFAILLLALILFLWLRACLRSQAVTFAMNPAGWILLAALIAVLLVRGILLVGEISRYREEKNRLRASEPLVQRVLADEQRKVEEEAGLLAAAFESSLTGGKKDPIELLYRLERLADHHRLDYDYKGLMLVDESGDALEAIGLARGWRSLADLGASVRSASGPAMMGNMPVYVGIDSVVVGGSPRFLVFVSSFLDGLPHALAGVAGSSVRVRLDGRTLAWSGASQRPSPSLQPWFGFVRPFWELPLEMRPWEHRLSLLFTSEDYRNAASPWLDLCIVLLVLALFRVTSLRRDIAGSPRYGGWWFVLFAAVYFACFLILVRVQPAQRPVSLSGHGLEFLLHLLGLLGLALFLRVFFLARRETRLSLTVLVSYLVVGIIPLALALVIGTNLLQQAQQRVIQNTMADLEERADHLVMAYISRLDFLSGVYKESPRLLSRTPETLYYDFVGDDQQLFTYDLPSAYLTLWVQDELDPSQHFTGFSWRAPRTGKFFPSLPEWMKKRNQRGIFLDGGRTVVRAVRASRFRNLDIQLVSHIPLDNSIISNLEEHLRILPFLPRVRFQPAWYGTVGSPVRVPGWDLPFSTAQVLAARDWRTGEPGWVVYQVRAYLPAGGEKWTILAVVILLVLLPLGLSVWGAYYTFRQTVQPLNRLLTGIRRVEKGDLEYRLADSGRGEIAQSARAFDRMADSLEANVRELAEKRKIEEVSALKSRFISMISHDLKTPLASIKGATENVLEELAGPITERQRTYLEMILASSKNLQQMISDILDLSHIESGRLILTVETLDLRREVETVLKSIRPFLEEGRIEARITVTVQSPKVKADSSRLWQIINNVISNAIRYSPEGGVIDILIDEEPMDATGAQLRFLRMTITDQGPGIPEDEQARLFEPFYASATASTRKHGAGLGLAIVKQLVELHGGRVSIVNSEKGGARLSFTLPAAQ